MRFQDKVVIVTGGARGIGLACAEAFHAEGARVAIADTLADVGAGEAERLGDGAMFVACDVADRQSVHDLVAAVRGAWGPIDVAVSSAGISTSAGFLDVTEDDWDRVLGVNLKGTFLVGQAVAADMVASGTAGAIVNMSSVNAVMAIPEIVPYTASKGGVNQLTKAMALALADHGIRVNAVGPGSIDTDMLRAVNTDAAAMRRVMSRTPLGRIGSPAEIAQTVLFLASDHASYVSGQTIYADGGRLAMNYTVDPDRALP